MKHWTAFFNKPIPNMILRLIVMGFGLFCVAFSVALSRATGLGTSPISSLPCVLSYMVPITIGTFTFIINVLFIIAQVVLLKKEFNPLQLLQLPFLFVFSALIDLCVPFCETLPMSNYFLCCLFLVLSVPITAFGVWIQVQAKLIILPGDAVILAISKVFNVDFGRTKIIFDTSLVTLAALTSFFTMGGLYGVREGTIFAALTVGAVVAFYNRSFPSLEAFMPTEGHFSLSPQSEREREEKARIKELK